MRRLFLLLILATTLLVPPGPTRAQATTDQLNKLSLEALTAPPVGGGGYSGRSYRTVRSGAGAARGYARRHPAARRHGSYSGRSEGARAPAAQRSRHRGGRRAAVLEDARTG